MHTHTHTCLALIQPAYFSELLQVKLLQVRPVPKSKLLIADVAILSTGNNTSVPFHTVQKKIYHKLWLLLTEKNHQHSTYCPVRQDAVLTRWWIPLDHRSCTGPCDLSLSCWIYDQVSSWCPSSSCLEGRAFPSHCVTAASAGCCDVVSPGLNDCCSVDSWYCENCPMTCTLISTALHEFNETHFIKNLSMWSRRLN